MRYAVIDDYGDQPYTGSIAFESNTLEEAYDWAEDRNFHSASIVKLYKNGKREVVNEPDCTP